MKIWKSDPKHVKTLGKRAYFRNLNRNMNINTWFFIQDSIPLHYANIGQDLLKEKLGKRFMKHPEWPLSFPDCNPLDYHFWNKVKEKMYENQFNQPIGN